MRILSARIGAIGVGLCLLAAPVATYFALITQRASDLAGVLLAIQAGVFAWVAMSMVAGSFHARARAVWRGLRGATAVALSATTLWIWQSLAYGPTLAAAVPHTLAYLGMLVLFAASLAPGREAIITLAARRSRGPLNATLLAYTRHVTWAWCLFFGAQLLTSLLLGRLAPLAWWAAFIAFGSAPLVLLMFGCELAYRHRRHGIHRPAGTAGTRAWLTHVFAQLRLPNRQMEP